MLPHAACDHAHTDQREKKLCSQHTELCHIRAASSNVCVLCAFTLSIALVMAQDIREKKLVFANQVKVPCLPAMRLGLMSNQPLVTAELLPVEKQIGAADCSAPEPCRKG